MPQQAEQGQAMTIQERFVRAWCAVENPDLDCFNPHFKSRYASLKETQRVIREACRPLELAYRQVLADKGEDGYRLESSLLCADGSEMGMSAFPVENIPNSQAFGSEMTYKKRQQAQADWGIVGEEDDDGNAIAGTQQARAGKSATKGGSAPPRASGGSKRPKAGKWTRLNELKARAVELGISEEGQKGAIANVMQGKPLKDATPDEIRSCEDVVQGLIDDMLELRREEEAGYAG